jgi:hypothetical protein
MTTPDTTTELFFDPTTGTHAHIAAHLIDAASRPMGHLEAAAFMTMWHHRTVDGQVPTEFFPFIEGEDGDITGPGHQDPATFAALVSAYDAAENTGVMAHDPTASSAIEHRWLKAQVDVVTGEWSGVYVAPFTEGAIPVTTVTGRW